MSFLQFDMLLLCLQLQHHLLKLHLLLLQDLVQTLQLLHTHTHTHKYNCLRAMCVIKSIFSAAIM